MARRRGICRGGALTAGLSLRREAGGQIHLLGKVERCRAIEEGAYDIGGSIRLDVPRDEIERHVRALRRSA